MTVATIDHRLEVVHTLSRPHGKSQPSRVERPTKHIIGHIGDDFYRSDDPTNSVKH